MVHPLLRHFDTSLLNAVKDKAVGVAATAIVVTGAGLFVENKHQVQVCVQNAIALETRYQRKMVMHMRTAAQYKKRMGDRYPEAFFLAPVLATDGEREEAWEAMREGSIFWGEVYQLYTAGLLLQPWQRAPVRRLYPRRAPAKDQGFFSNKWAGRGKEYRNLMEPLDIANWYFKNKHVSKEGTSGAHYTSGIKSELEDNNHKRPDRYIFLQQQEARVLGMCSVKSSLAKGWWFKETLKESPWEDMPLTSA